MIEEYCKWEMTNEKLNENEKWEMKNEKWEWEMKMRNENRVMN